jgi:translation initiation factor 1
MFRFQEYCRFESAAPCTAFGIRIHLSNYKLQNTHYSYLMTQVRKKSAGSVLVYSTQTGRICPGCSQPVGQCSCQAVTSALKSDGIVRVSFETKGRRGKGVTVIKGVALDAGALADLAKQLKAACGSGGTTKDGVIEIQGDHRDLVLQKLAPRGWVVKRAGG